MNDQCDKLETVVSRLSTGPWRIFPSVEFGDKVPDGSKLLIVEYTEP